MSQPGNVLRFEAKKKAEAEPSKRRRLRPPNSHKPGCEWKDADLRKFLKWSAKKSRRREILIRIASAVIRKDFNVTREDIEDFWSDFSSPEIFKRRIRRFDPQLGGLLRYVIRGCAMHVIGQLRKRQKERPLPSEEHPISPAQALKRTRQLEAQLHNQMVLRKIRYLLNTNFLNPVETAAVRR